MHSKRIMHRDLKPENIMLRSNSSCEPIIADFGLATWADESEYLFVRCGTPGYVAPEIINIRDMKTKSDPICDVFSVGLIFHILLMGKSIFPGKTYNDVLNQNRACDFFLEAPEYQGINRSAHHLLKAMLEKDPRKRISASDALKHPYLSEMDIEQTVNPSHYVYAETPLKVVEENKPSDYCWPSPKVSVFTHKDDSSLLSTILINHRKCHKQ
jgi:serine/threonine protein kinase